MNTKQVYEVVAITNNSVLSFRFDTLAEARKKEKELKRGKVMVITFGF